MIEDNEQHDDAAEQDGKLVEVLVGDHGGDSAVATEDNQLASDVGEKEGLQERVNGLPQWSMLCRGVRRRWRHEWTRACRIKAYNVRLGGGW